MSFSYVNKKYSLFVVLCSQSMVILIYNTAIDSYSSPIKSISSKNVPILSTLTNALHSVFSPYMSQLLPYVRHGFSYSCNVICPSHILC